MRTERSRLRSRSDSPREAGGKVLQPIAIAGDGRQGEPPGALRRHRSGSESDVTDPEPRDPWRVFGSNSSAGSSASTTDIAEPEMLCTPRAGGRTFSMHADDLPAAPRPPARFEKEEEEEEEEGRVSRRRSRTSSFHEKNSKGMALAGPDPAVEDAATLEELEDLEGFDGLDGDMEGALDLITVNEDLDVDLDADEPVPDDPSERFAMPRSPAITVHRQGSGGAGSGKKGKGALTNKTLSIVSNLGEDPAASPEGSEEELAAERERSWRGSRNAPRDLRVLLLGDSGVGKTSLMRRFSANKFSSSLLSTAGVDYQWRNAVVRGKSVRLRIWDTAGQEKFHVITRSYYRNAHGICLVYSVADRESFENVRYWMANIDEHASGAVQRVLVGNKSDLTARRQVTYEMGEALAQEFGDVFMETSALDGTNVAEAFMVLAEKICDAKPARSPSPSPEPPAARSSIFTPWRQSSKGREPKSAGRNLWSAERRRSLKRESEHRTSDSGSCVVS